MSRSAIARITTLMPRRGGRPWKVGLVALVLSGLVLAGCYASPGLLLDRDEAVQPLIDGVYARDGDPSDRFQLTETADGWYRVERFNANGTIGETHQALLTPMALEDGRAAFAIAEQTDDGYAYAVAMITNGRVQLATPDCADPLDRNLAVDHGGDADDDSGMTPACTFHNRGALLSALAAFAGQADFGRPYQRH
jgi:hypothetical protein